MLDDVRRWAAIGCRPAVVRMLPRIRPGPVPVLGTVVLSARRCRNRCHPLELLATLRAVFDVRRNFKLSDPFGIEDSSLCCRKTKGKSTARKTGLKY